jgi:hypothetical protein
LHLCRQLVLNRAAIGNVSVAESNVFCGIDRKENQMSKLLKSASQKSNKGKSTATTKSRKESAKVERTYGLDKDMIVVLKNDKAYNAYRVGSSYGYVVESLHTLGINKFHLADKLIAAYQAECDKAKLKNFKSKECRNDETGKDWRQRIIQNATVTCRQDYGLKMRQIGWEVRQERNDKGLSFGLFKLSKASK